MDLKKLLSGTVTLLSGLEQLSEAASRRRQAKPRASVPMLGDGSEDAPMQLKVHRVSSINERVKYIRQQIEKGRNDPRFRALAVKLVSRKRGGRWAIPERDYIGEVKAVFGYIRNNIRYVRDPLHRDTFQHPRRTLELGGGDCDDYTITMGAMLEAIGYPVKMRVIQTVDSADFNHIYLMVGIPPHSEHPRWLALDASVNKPAGWQPPASTIRRYKDFPVS